MVDQRYLLHGLRPRICHSVVLRANLPSAMRSGDSCLRPDFTATLLIGYYGVQMRGGSEEYCPSRVRLSDVRDGTTLAGILHKQGRRPKA